MAADPKKYMLVSLAKLVLYVYSMIMTILTIGFMFVHEQALYVIGGLFTGGLFMTYLFLEDINKPTWPKQNL